MELLLAFTFADREHFEPISRRPISREFFDAARPLLPEHWTLAKGGMWLMGTGPNVGIPEQGFKIHVSATVDNAINVIQRVLPECVSANTAFKIIADVNLLYLAGCKNFGRGSSSKFITIYPQSDALFAELIESLHERTRDLNGPYILSDARYKDSRVVFYRYGGFQRTDVVKLSGTREPVIRDPAGEFVPDQRLPFYTLPEWVDDPFGNTAVSSYAGSHTLHDRYEIEASLAFSNRGGVYRARDVRTGHQVVVKEARPLTATWNGDGKTVDAVSILRDEHAILSKLQGLPFIPRLIDLFEEWEHLFLVEEFVAGIPLTRYRARHEVALIPFTGAPERTRAFCSKFKTIAEQLMNIVRTLHNRGVVLGDLSPNNVLIDPESMVLRLIDLEAAKDVDDARNASRLWTVWATEGFASPARTGDATGVAPEDDLYALGMILYSLIIPVQAMFHFDPSAAERILFRVDEAVGLPEQIPAIVTSLVHGNAREAEAILANWDIDDSLRTGSGPRSWTMEALEEEVGNLAAITHQIAEHILSSTTLDRTDRLWPADYLAFQTNPLSVAYGACGTLLFLHDVYGSVPQDVAEWCLRQPISLDKYPPGLYVGVAGVAQTMLELGYHERATELLHLAHVSPLSMSDPTMFHGAAGIGLADLRFYEADRQQVWLDHAMEVGEYLLRESEPRAGGCCWRNRADGLVHFGFGYGSSGIALFLLYLGHITDDARCTQRGLDGLAFDAGSAVEIGGTRKWVRFEGDSLTEPYWLHGASGIGSALARASALTANADFAIRGAEAADAAFSRIAVTPGQIEGLSGMAEFMLDMFLLTGQDTYRARALELARSILCFRVDRPTGIAFPGRQLIRLSSDFAFGSAGVGSFLHRLSRLAPRRFHDLQSVGVHASGACV